VTRALSHAGAMRLRWMAVISLGLRRDPQSLDELTRMLDDRSARIRGQSVGWYIARIHPDRAVTTPLAVAAPAPPGVAVAGLEHLIERTRDENFNVRRAAVSALGAFRQTGDPRVDATLREALQDAKRKVKHAAARALAVPCPGCGKSW
jgi:hypothetical protein